MGAGISTTQKVKRDRKVMTNLNPQDKKTYKLIIKDINSLEKGIAAFEKKVAMEKNKLTEHERAVLTRMYGSEILN